MVTFILWYLLVAALGLAIFPLAFYLFPGLPDRGYAFSKILALLGWGYVFWMLGSLGVLRNNLGGQVLALGLIFALSVWVLSKTLPGEIQAFFHSQRSHIFVVEAVFLIAFGGWTLVRAANPQIYATEKPMELAFINAILKSPTFPPNDPWLSGYAISYYYFGYVLTAMLAELTGVTAGVAFNLGISLVFGLSAVGAYGVVFNLLAAARLSKAERATLETHPSDQASPWRPALLGPIFVLLIGNVEGLLEILHARGWFWQADSADAISSRFWTWLDIPQLAQAPPRPFSWLPADYSTGSWWWWQASRVVQDYDLVGNWKEVIDEFPFFSFLLADLHPHVLAIPFAFLAMALALNVYLGGARGQTKLGRFTLSLRWQGIAFAGLVLGGLAFLNTWDFPMYVGLFAGAYVLIQVRQLGWSWTRLGEFLLLGVILGVLGVVLYLPFYIGFSSQAGGFLPNLVYPTRGAHMWVMFGLFFIPLFAYLIFSWREAANPRLKSRGLLLAVGISLVLFLLALLLGAVLIGLPSLESIGLTSLGGNSLESLRDLFLGSIGARGLQDVLLQDALVRRITNSGGWITLVVLLGLTLGLLWPENTRHENQGDAKAAPDVQPFVLLLILLATLLVFMPEFFYLRDQFGWRINTIFKFYYQAWLLWGIAVAYGVTQLVTRPHRRWRIAFQSGLLLILGVGFIYPLLSIWDKTHGFRPAEGLALDGTRQGFYLSLDENAAIDWLRNEPQGYLSEAIGGSYSAYGRVSANTGHPAVLGWPGHESQWRGGAREMGTRERDIEHLYSTRDWDEAKRILDLYNIQYVYIGPLERTAYNVSDLKFQRFMNPVFEQGPVIIYTTP